MQIYSLKSFLKTPYILPNQTTLSDPIGAADVYTLPYSTNEEWGGLVVGVWSVNV